MQTSEGDPLLVPVVTQDREEGHVQVAGKLEDLVT